MGRGLWITPVEDERFWWLLLWLLSQREVRDALLIPEPVPLPVIAY